jgi:hypothetical protein
MKPKFIELPQALTIDARNNCSKSGVKSLQEVCYHLLSGQFDQSPCFTRVRIGLQSSLVREKINLTAHLRNSGAIR